MRYLIVNADDFGASHGINCAILELHQRGALTSASLMIDMPAAGEAAEMARQAPELGVGLHVTLTSEDAAPLADFNNRSCCTTEMEAQFGRFTAALDRTPTHIDSHQNIHRDPRLTPVFIEFADRHGLPLREHSPARYFSSFYGQWEGETHLEQISVENLLRMIEEEMGEGFTELSCHPGYMDSSFESSYHAEREVELRTLSDPRFLAFLRERRISLVAFWAVARVCGEVA